MQYVKNITGSEARITIQGKMTFASHNTFKSLIDELIEARFSKVTFDLAGVDFIDSAALGLFLVMNEKISGFTEIFIENTNGNVKKVMDSSNFSKIFSVV